VAPAAVPVLDHVALAAPSIAPLLDRYRGDLGATWVGGGPTRGYSFAQVRFANGMKVEVLEPHRVDEFDFLARFLERHGPGAHHYTFKVRSLAEALEAVTAAGYEPTGVQLDGEPWKEAFLLPRETGGIVVQLAQATTEPDTPAPVGLVDPRVARPALLGRVVHLVRSLAAARRLFVGVLGGQVIDRGAGWLELAWPGPGRIGFLEPEPGSRWDHWVGERSGRMGWLDFSLVDPGPFTGVLRDDLGQQWLPADLNHGVWLRLR
jgi:methylmalonyl-CoA/ethylmalonyl-CoA epimerase